jgi:group I intron endonuclease
MSDEWSYELRWFTVYVIRNKVNGKGYVGITIKSLDRRMDEHITAALLDQRRSKNGRLHPLYAAFRKYGPDKFTIEQLARAYGLSEAQDLEEQFIEELHTYASGGGSRMGYNLTRGGEEPDLPYG